MIPLRLPAEVEADRPFVTRVRLRRPDADVASHAIDESEVVVADPEGLVLSGRHGLITLDGIAADELDGDVLLVDPARRSAERLIRASSPHNTLLVTERCDQLCQMCSQPPKKTHDDRFALLEEACLLAPTDVTIGITGGEPTLYKTELLNLIERVLGARPDLAFHVLSNGQHFTLEDVERLRAPCYDRVLWGIPLYAADAGLHDTIVGKTGALERLHESFTYLLKAGARIELRTVLLNENAGALPELSRHVVLRAGFVEQWSLMQLESIGYARARWRQLLFDHTADFSPIAAAVDRATLNGLRTYLFNFPLCTVPPAYRHFAVRSISDWKQKYAPSCDSCAEMASCAGFFEWHPEEDALRWARPL